MAAAPRVLGVKQRHAPVSLPHAAHGHARRPYEIVPRHPVVPAVPNGDEEHGDVRHGGIETRPPPFVPYRIESVPTDLIGEVHLGGRLFGAVLGTTVVQRDPDAGADGAGPSHAILGGGDVVPAQYTHPELAGEVGIDGGGDAGYCAGLASVRQSFGLEDVPRGGIDSESTVVEKEVVVARLEVHGDHLTTQGPGGNGVEVRGGRPEARVTGGEDSRQVILIEFDPIFAAVDLPVGAELHHPTLRDGVHVGGRDGHTLLPVAELDPVEGRDPRQGEAAVGNHGLLVPVVSRPLGGRHLLGGDQEGILGLNLGLFSTAAQLDRRIVCVNRITLDASLGVVAMGLGDAHPLSLVEHLVRRVEVTLGLGGAGIGHLLDRRRRSQGVLGPLLILPPLFDLLLLLADVLCLGRPLGQSLGIFSGRDSQLLRLLRGPLSFGDLLLHARLMTPRLGHASLSLDARVPSHVGRLTFFLSVFSELLGHMGGLIGLTPGGTRGLGLTLGPMTKAVIRLLEGLAVQLGRPAFRVGDGELVDQVGSLGGLLGVLAYQGQRQGVPTSCPRARATPRATSGLLHALRLGLPPLGSVLLVPLQYVELLVDTIQGLLNLLGLLVPLVGLVVGVGRFPLHGPQFLLQPFLLGRLLVGLLPVVGRIRLSPPGPLLGVSRPLLGNAGLSHGRHSHGLGRGRSILALVEEFPYGHHPLGSDLSVLPVAPRLAGGAVGVEGEIPLPLHGGVERLLGLAQPLARLPERPGGLVSRLGCDHGRLVCLGVPELGLIDRFGEEVLNLHTVPLLPALDRLGRRGGRDVLLRLRHGEQFDFESLLLGDGTIRTLRGSAPQHRRLG
mmetsp:Transcript_32196/g.96502  ORF Transcript_32196/g.96502 Transcript_32196/m.96502 type:complete len:838 (-) Transcript_32196:951-3464(-)